MDQRDLADRPTSAFDLDFRPRGEVMPSPADWRDVVVYQLLFDRFDDGKDRPKYEPGTYLTRGEFDKDAGGKWQGGTIKGAIRRLDYLKNLGVGAVWVSPPLKQRAIDEHSYHGYAIQDFLQIDPRLGTADDFAEFVRQAHARDMRVIMDVVIDHTADVWGYDGDVTFDGGDRHDIAGWHDGGSPGDFGPDQGIWPAEFQTPDAFKRLGRMNDTGSARGAEAKDGDFMSLKVLELSNRHILAAVVNCCKYWIAVADVDGFRIDALRHIRHPNASDFCHAIREYALSIGKHDFFLVGEVADSDEEMRRYIGTNVELLDSDQRDPETDPDNTGDYPKLDAVIDFELHRRLIPVLLGERPASDLADLCELRRNYFRDYGRSGRSYLSYLENHDQGGRDHHRLLNGSSDQTPDGYDRPGGDPRLAIMANTVLLASMGVPCLYYGTEQGFDGGGEGDVNVREAMFGGTWGPFGTGRSDDAAGGSAGLAPHYFDESHPIFAAVAELAAARRREPVLRYGRQYYRLTPTNEAGPFAFVRVLDVTEVVVAANPTLEEREVSVAVDSNLNPPGTQLIDLCTDDCCTEVQGSDDGSAWVNLTLKPRAAVVLRQHCG